MTRIGTTSTPRQYGLVAALAVVALVACTSSAAAATKDFSLTVSPSSAPAGRVVAVTATVTNLTKTQQLGSANLTPPSGYTALSVTSLSRPAPATATIVAGVVALRELSLPPRASVTVGLQVSTPCAGGVTSAYGIVAKQANDFSGLPGNSLTLDPTRSAITMTTTGACAPCPENQSCSVDLGGPGGTQAHVVAEPDPNQPDAGLLTTSLVSPLDCAGYAERSPDTFTLDAPLNRPKLATLTYSSATRPVTGQDPLEVCFGAPVPFEVRAKTLLTTTIIDGQLFYVGRLANCTGAPVAPCVTDRNNQTRTIELLMAPGDPHLR
ncbi:MAG: hypothetical protein ACRDKY_03620 [Solirubrobacteraceae bacterium]